MKDKTTAAPEGTQTAAAGGEMVEDLEALEAATRPAGAAAPVEVKASVITEDMITGNLMKLWQVRGFRRNVSRVNNWPSGDGCSQNLADVIVEIGTSGLYQKGIRVSKTTYNQNAAEPGLRGKSGLVIRLNSRQVGSGENRQNIAIYETESVEGDRNLKAWKKAVVAAYNDWVKRTGQSAEAAAAAGVFDSDAE